MHGPTGSARAAARRRALPDRRQDRHRAARQPQGPVAAGRQQIALPPAPPGLVHRLCAGRQPDHRPGRAGRARRLRFAAPRRRWRGASSTPGWCRRRRTPRDDRPAALAARVAWSACSTRSTCRCCWPCLCVMLISLVVLASAGGDDSPAGDLAGRALRRRPRRDGAGIAGAAGASCGCGRRWLTSPAWCCWLLVFVFGSGRSANLWLDLGVFYLQPGELLKLTVPMMVAWYLHGVVLPPRWLTLARRRRSSSACRWP